MNFNFFSVKKKPKEDPLSEDPLSYAPRFCHSDGNELIYKEEYAFNPYTGEKYPEYKFVQCPNWAPNAGWEHGRYQWRKGNGENSTWIPLDNFQ